jgi:hypothetical protein
VAENSLPGTLGWGEMKLNNNIEGFASATSVEAGDTLSFYVNTTAEQFDIAIFRLGYYGGVGARLVQEVHGLARLVQAAPQRDPWTGLASCSHWVVSFQLVIPSDWVSGIYMAKLVRTDDGGTGLIYFVVREHGREKKSALLFQQSVNTYQAYNAHGGKSLYHHNSDTCQTLSAGPRAVKVSFDRPITLDPFGPNQFFLTDFPFVYWLEAQGYDVSYCTNIDMHRAGKAGAPNTLLGHRAILLVGHDEYYSQEMRDALLAARDAGVHIGVFSANTGYWRVRLEPDPITGTPDRVLCCYKTTESGEPDPISPTGTWRDPETTAEPEGSWVGVQYVGNNGHYFFPIRVSAEQSRDAVFRHTPLAHLQPNQYAELGSKLVGWEWDAAIGANAAPANLQILAASPVFGNVLEDAGSRYKFGQAVSHMTRYVAPSGAQVFAVGTNQWGWGLAVFDVDARVRQITCNVLADMGVFPATPDAALIFDEGAPMPHPTEANQPRHEYRDGTQTELAFLLASPHSHVGETFATQIATLAQSPSSPTISNLIVQAAATQVTIQWTTSEPTAGQVWLRIAPAASDYKLSVVFGLSLPVVGVGVSPSYGLTHSVQLQQLDPNQTYYATIAATTPLRQVTFLIDQRVETAKGSILDSAKYTLRTWYRALPCWIRQNTTTWAVAMATLTGVLAGAVMWRVRRLRQLRKLRR